MRCHCGAEFDATATHCPACGARAGDSTTSNSDGNGAVIAGTIIFEKYEVIRLLGSGGMGQVYLARDLQLERMIALKTLSKELSRNQEHKSRFMREARMASALNHPNILTVFEIGAVGDELFMATEYVEGDTLRHIGRNSQFSLRECVDISIQATQGLAAAHEAGIIHRDLKLENFILRQDGYLKILDFGLAKGTDALADTSATDGFKTQAGIILGTPNYMSPEQAKGKQLDARSDIFSFGAVLYELLSRRVAFEGENDMQVLFNVAFKQPDPLPEHVPLRLREIVKRAMQKAPEARYPNMRAFMEDLIATRDELQANGLFSTAIDKALNKPRNTGSTERLMATGMQSRLTAMGERFDSVQISPTLTPEYDQFVGREPEMNILRNEFQRANEGKARPVLILGDSGSGKTQMLNRFQQWVLEQGAIISFSSFFDYSGNLSQQYQAILAMLASAIGLRDTDHGAKKDGDIGQRIASHIKSNFNIELPRAMFERQSELNNEAEKWQIFEALRQLFLRFTQDRPFVMLLDNLHWADAMTIDLLGYLLRDLTGARLMIVATGSDEEAVKVGAPLREWLLAQSRYITFEQLKLKPFTATDVRAMLDAIFRRIEISAREIDRLCEVTSGNPYYLVEVVRLLVHNNKIALGEGWWRCESLNEMELPTTVGIAVQYKLEQCSEALREVLTQAAVLGDNFKFDLLAELAEKDEDELEKLLSIAIKAFLIREERGSRGDDYRFYNATIRRVLYESLSKRQRRRQHSRAAGAIQKIYRGKLQRVMGALAYHYNAAGEWQEAFNFGVKAVDQVIEQELWSEVAKYAQWVEEAASAIAESPDEYIPIEQALLAEIRIKHTTALLRLGNIAASAEQAKSALKVAEQLNNPFLIARSKARLSELGWYQGRFAEAIRVGEEGLIAAKEAGDAVSERQLHYHVGVSAWRSTPFANAIEHLKLSCELSEASGDDKLLAHARSFYGIVLHCQGNWREAHRCLKKNIDYARQNGDRFAESRCYSVTSVMLYYERRHIEMMDVHKETIPLMRAVGWRIGEGYMHMLIGFDFLSPTNLDIGQARDFLQRGLAICQETGEKGFQLLALRGLAKVSTLLGDYEQAIARLHEVLAILRQVGELFEQVATLCYLGDAFEMANQPEQALEAYRSCQELTEKLNFPFWQWQALFGQGRVLHQLNRNREAISKLSMACAIVLKLRHEFESDRQGANFLQETQAIYDTLGNLSS